MSQDNLQYVAISVHAYGFGPTRDEAIRQASINVIWSSVKPGNDAPVVSYAYHPDQKLEVSTIDGHISWSKAALFDVRANKIEGTIPRKKGRR
jgi:hypothetical protein